MGWAVARAVTITRPGVPAATTADAQPRGHGPAPRERWLSECDSCVNLDVWLERVDQVGMEW